MSFVYRTIFLTVLSKEYLGISGLFTNILQIFSLTELGIGSAICYRLYKPIKDKDENKCHALMTFYKDIYHVIGIVILVLGFIFSFYLDSFIADPSEIPSDINIYKIYWLYVIQSSFSYFFVYSQTLLTADQRGYTISLWNSVFYFVSNIIKIIILLIFKNYTMSLAVGIILTLLYNCLFSSYIFRQYHSIFLNNSKLNIQEKLDVFKDSGSLMCHKIGYIVLTSIDNLVLSKYIGVSVLGIYSNYSMIVSAVDTLLNKMLGGFVSSVGDMMLEKNKDDCYKVYKKLLFDNLYLTSFCTVCIYCLINNFIILWLDESYVLEQFAVIIITFNFFLTSSEITNLTFINANGLFVKDKIRPLIQATINLFISITLVKKIGITGVFIGTVISNLLTVWWRQPIIVYKYIFNKDLCYYFIEFLKWLCLTIIIIFIYNYMFSFLDFSLLSFIIRILVCVILTNIIYIILNSKNEIFKSQLLIVKNKLKSLIKKRSLS